MSVEYEMLDLVLVQPTLGTFDEKRDMQVLIMHRDDRWLLASFADGEKLVVQALSKALIRDDERTSKNGG